MDKLLWKHDIMDIIKKRFPHNYSDDGSNQYDEGYGDALNDIGIAVSYLPSAEPERKEVIPYRNYQYLSDYWCECGNHLGKKYEVTYCSDCGRKVNWDE